MNNRFNPISLTDRYSLSHYILKENLDYDISLLFNRGKPMILNGFNKIINDLLHIKLTERIVREEELKAKKEGGPFPIDMWMKIVEKFNGYLPLKVEGLEDGTWVPRNAPFVKISNTEKGFGEIPSWNESVCMEAFFTSGCATEAFKMRKYLDKNNLSSNRIHSFQSRSHRSTEDRLRASMAWDLFLDGSDDFITSGVTGYHAIVPAEAHKVIQQFDDELSAYIHGIDATVKAGLKILSIVIDTYDPIRFIKKYAEIVARRGKEKGLHIVFRPDSGNVFEQTCMLYDLMLRIGCEKFTSVIIGEGMTFNKIKQYDNSFKYRGVPLSWVYYGMGGGFHNHITRDYLGFAMKTSFSNGKPRMKFSADPIKRSIAGDVDLFKDKNNEMFVDLANKQGGLYRTIYYHDKYLIKPSFKRQSWKEIKAIASIQSDRQKVIKVSDDVNKMMSDIEKVYFI